MIPPITGYHLVNGWAKERPLYFAARYSRPFDKAADLQRRKAGHLQHLSFSQQRRRRRERISSSSRTTKRKAQEPILVKVAVSAVSAANALQESRLRNPRLEFRRSAGTHPRQVGPRTGSDPDRRLAGRKGNLLHLALSRLPRAQSLRGRHRRISRTRSGCSQGQGLHELHQSSRFGTPIARRIRSSPSSRRRAMPT